MSEGLEIIDAHVHIGPAFGNLTEPPPTAESVEGLVSAMDRARIARACLMAPSWEGGEFEDSDYHLANRFIWDAARRFPTRLTGICRINPNLATAALDEMKRCHDEYGFRGLKLHPEWEFFTINSRMLHPYLELAAEYAWPVFLHSGYYPLSQPGLVMPVAEAYPDTNFVLFHLGYRHIDDAVIVAAHCRNVYLETSANSTSQAIRGVLKQLGAAKLIYGSAFPSGNFREVQSRIRMLPDLEGTDTRAIFAGNVKRLIQV